MDSSSSSSSSAAAALVVAPPSGNSYHASRRHASSASCSCTPIQTSMIDATSTVACVLMCLTVCRLHGCPAAANSACESSSVMFGSPWSPGNPLYIQESSWKTHGNITKINVYVDPESGCLLGLKATYGWQAANARRLGVEKQADGVPLPSMDIKLSKDEYVVKAQYKFGSCITYFSLETTSGRQLAVGDIDSAGPLQTSRPEWADGFLAFFKAYTLPPPSSGSSGQLEQLQLVWSSKSCVGEQKQQLAEAMLGEARDPATVRTSSKKQTPAAATAAAATPAEAEVTVSEATPAEAAGAAAVAPASASATVNATAAALVPAAAAAAAGPANPAAAGVAEGEADAAMAADMNAAAAAAGTPETPVAAVVTSAEVEEVVVTTTATTTTTAPAETPTAAATATTTTAAAAAPAATPAAKPAATPKPASAPGKIKSLFVGPQKKPPSDAPSSSTVINTTTIITSTTTDKIPSPTATTYTTSTLTAATTTTTAVCNPGGNCANGTCATSSCMLNGMGKDVATMMCFGTNLMPNPLLDATLGNPCTNLACKLDRPNCTTTNFGLDGFCTGKVVSMGATAKLHASGKSFLGYPCIEHRGPVLDLVPLGDYTARGVYMAKAWKVCDCISGLGTKDGSITLDLPLGASLTIIPPKFPTLPQYPWIDRGLINMSLPDVLAQWVAANLADAPMPTLTIEEPQTLQLKSLLPNFTLPSIVVPKISAPLMKLPANFSLPVFTIPIGNRTLQRVLNLLPDLTALPTLMTPKIPSVNISVTTSQVTLPELTISNLGELAESFGVPHMPKLPSLSNMSFADALTQWVVAKQFSMPVVTVRLPEVKLRSLAELLPDFKVPSLVVPNISMPLLRLPKPFPVHVAAIPNDADVIKALESIFPRGKLTSLPAFVTAPIMPLGTPRLPLLSLRNITIPKIEEIAIEVGVAPPKWFNIDLEKMAMQLSNMTWRMPTLQYTMPASMNFSLPSITIPDINLPQMPQMQLPNLPGLPKPNLTRITAAMSSMPDIAADISQWPKLIDQWKAKHLSRPFDFDLSAFTKLVTTNPQIAAPDGMEISFEVPNVMAQWIAGIVQKVPLPQLTVQDVDEVALKALLPQLPSLPALLVVNMSTPYFNAEAKEMQDLPTVVVPDSMVPKVTSLLPNLTFVPSLLVPSSSSSSSSDSPSISVTLPEVTLDQIATPNFMKTVQNMLSNVKGRAGVSEQVSVSMAPAAAAPARGPAATTTTVVTTTTTTPAPAAAAATTTVSADTAATAAAADAAAAATTTVSADTAATAAAADAAAATTTVTAAPTPVPAAAVPAAAAAPPTGEPVVTEAPPGAALGTAPAKPGSQEVTAGTPKAESAHITDVTDFEMALDADGEGASKLPQGLVAGPQTAFMDPKDWAKLDKATQQEFLAIFNP
uniref:Uncharacterized protein n=1 Tax=Tetradesmus obliquus TaxID=3088 RepID=A0A383V773_TETOB|eukprot:jgi/Sobl393_1/17575/SZX61435.1